MKNNILRPVDRTVNVLIGESYPVVKEVYEHLGEIDNLQTASDNLNEITSNLPTIKEVEDNLPNINEVVVNIESIKGNFENLEHIKGAKKYADSAKRSADAAKISEDAAKRSEDNCQEIVSNVNEYLTDFPHLAESLEEVENCPMMVFCRWWLRRSWAPRAGHLKQVRQGKGLD